MTFNFNKSGDKIDCLFCNKKITVDFFFRTRWKN